MKLKLTSIFLISGIMCILIAGCSLSENKARNIINEKLNQKKNTIILKVQGDKAQKVFKYLTQNKYIDHLPTKHSANNDKQYKIMSDNGIIYTKENSYLTTKKDPNTGELFIELPLHIHERVKKINKMTNDPDGKKSIINYTVQYNIIKSSDAIWNWCKATETCSVPLSNYLNDEYKAQITLVKGKHGWE